MKKSRYISAEKLSKQLAHDQLHIQKLSEKYDDLSIMIENDLIIYYSALINPQANQFDLHKGTFHYEEYYHYFLSPYTILNIGCDYCKGDIKIHTIPSNIKLIMVHNDTNEITVHSFIYEDLLKEYNFHPSILSGAELQIIKLIDELSTSQYKTLNLNWVPKKIRNLLPFV